MKFQVGDKVLVLHSNEEGEVVDIINPKMVMVDVRGVKFPAYTDQLDFPYFRRFTEKKPEPKKPQKKYVDQVPREKNSALKVPDGMWISFIPVFDTDEFGDDIVESLKIHLVNNTSAAFHFKYEVQYGGVKDFDLKNEIFPFQDFYLHDIPFAVLNDSPSFHVEFSLVTPDKQKVPSATFAYKPRPKQIFSKIEELKKKGEATLSHQLFKQYPDKPVEDPIETAKLSGAGYRIYDAGKIRQHLEPAKHEIDLHIERLSPNWQHLSNFEILALQLQTFEKYFDLAIAHHQPSLIVIHGVGSGKLRDEIHELLRLRREVKSFINQYDPRYGYGATEIFFQYK